MKLAPGWSMAADWTPFVAGTTAKVSEKEEFIHELLVAVIANKISETAFSCAAVVLSYEQTPSFDKCSMIIFSGTFSRNVQLIAVARKL